MGGSPLRRGICKFFAVEGAEGECSAARSSELFTEDDLLGAVSGAARGWEPARGGPIFGNGRAASAPSEARHARVKTSDGQVCEAPCRYGSVQGGEGGPRRSIRRQGRR